MDTPGYYSYETEFQWACGKLVDREVYCCLSILISDLRDLMQNVSYEVQRNLSIDEETLNELCYSIDYEDAIDAWLNEGPTNVTKAVDNLGYLDDLLVELKLRPSDEKLVHYCDVWDVFEKVTQRDIDTAEDPELLRVGEFYFADPILRQSYPEIEGLLANDTEAQAYAIQQWTKDGDALDYLDEEDLDKVRAWCKQQIGDEAEAFCCEMCIETSEYESEVYEQWAVSDWLAYQLKKRGYRVVEIGNLYIWGRGTTGQSISIDGVIRQIVRETGYGGWNDAEEVAKAKAAGDTAIYHGV